MGNEESTMVDESVPPSTLRSRDLAGVSEYICSGKVRRVAVMSGAGISTSAGSMLSRLCEVPDFRSPETGLYANLARLNLPYVGLDAEAVFDIKYFREHPEPFYTLANELYPGKFRPTITHSFIKLLHDKHILLKHYTQNIDCLDREAGVPSEKIVEAHGSFARQSCIECKAPYSQAAMLEHVKRKAVPHCEDCDGLVKPEIVFFGESLPPEFFEARYAVTSADLVIVLGTSLTVQPFASLPSMVRQDTPRILINLEQVGNLGSRPDDVLILGECDSGVQKLAKACGWHDELQTLWKATRPRDEETPNRPVTAEDEIEKLTRDVDETLKLNNAKTARLRNDLGLGSPIAADLTEAEPGQRKAEKDLGHVFPHLRKDSKDSSL